MGEHSEFIFEATTAEIGTFASPLRSMICLGQKLGEGAWPQIGFIASCDFDFY